MRFEGKVALVTGAARGMGATHALGFAREGADVVAVDIGRDIPGTNYDLATNAELDRVVSEVEEMGRRAIGVTADVSRSAEVKVAVDRAIAEFGRIDILVNNAGILCQGPLIDITEQEINAVIGVNLKGVIYGCQHVIPHMVRQRYGKIINISSIAGLHAIPMVAVYSAAKYGVIGLTEALAAELCHYNINVNAVCPGGVRTPMTEKQSQQMFLGRDPGDIYSEIYAPHFFRREIPQQEVTNAVLFLASEEARNITSHMLPVTAGSEKKTPAAEAYFTV